MPALRGAYLHVDTALVGSHAYKTDIFAKYEAILQAAETRYSAGDLSLSEILPVRRDWAALQISCLESLCEVMQAWNEVNYFADVR